MSTRTLDIGCGGNPRNPFGVDEVHGLDINGFPEKNVIACDLVVNPIPYTSNYFDYVTAYDFIEHVPRVIYNPHRRFPFVELMNEIWRVLKLGGQFAHSTPAYPNPCAFRDPTHVNIITDETFPLYFDDKNRFADIYGFRGSFEIIKQLWVPNGTHLQTLMKKVEPIILNISKN